MIETVQVGATPRPTGFLWWFRNGDSWRAPEINNGLLYLPDTKAQWLRNFYWFCRNPIGNFMGFVIGFEGRGYTVTGERPVMATTPRDEFPPRHGWKTCKINGWAPFCAFWGPVWWLPKTYEVEFYLGWRPASGGFGFKFIPHKIAT